MSTKNRKNNSNMNKRELGEPPFNRIILGGTLSLAIMLLIGGVLMLVLAISEQSNFDAASIDDFQSLGKKGCLVIDASTYTVSSVQLKKLRSKCVETWTYNVEVVGTTSTKDDGSGVNGTTTSSSTYFVSNEQSASACNTNCEFCVEDDFNGKDFYRGVESNRPGRPIVNNRMFVECWVSRMPVNELSTFYDCDGQIQYHHEEEMVDEDDDVDPDNTSVCYQLQDPSIELKVALESNQLGMISAWLGVVGSIIFFCMGSFWVWRNRVTAREDQQLILAKQRHLESIHSHIDSATTNAAAIKMQSFFRAVAARKRVMKLLDGEIEELEQQIENSSSRSAGHTVGSKTEEEEEGKSACHFSAIIALCAVSVAVLYIVFDKSMG